MGKVSNLDTTNQQAIERFTKDLLEGKLTIPTDVFLSHNYEYDYAKRPGGVPERLHTLYPSRYEIGEKVKVFLMPEGEETFPGFNAVVTAVHFTISKVKYDLEIKFYGEHTSRIYNVDSILVKDAD